MILALKILLVVGLLAMLSAIILRFWRATKIEQRGAEEDMLKGCIKDWKE